MLCTFVLMIPIMVVLVLCAWFLLPLILFLCGIVFRWAAAAGVISLNALLLPAALYFWQIPHLMALAYMCREVYAAGGYVQV